MKKTILRSVLTLSVFAFGAISVHAVTVNATINASVKTDTQATKIIARSDTAIDARITALNDLSTRIGQLKNVSDSEKSTISATVATNVSGLTALKTKIDGETDVTTLESDEKTITGSFRIYALIIPQGRILASADRAVTIGALLSTVETKLQTRLNDAQTSGKDVSASATLIADMSAKITAANTEASAAAQGVIALKPDNGDKTVAASNHTALVAARAHMKTSTADLATARDDAKAIIKNLK